MDAAARGSLIYLFGKCVLNTSARSLQRGGRAVAVEPKVLDLLIYLLQQRGRVVSREILQRQLWPETAVSGAALSRLVKEARRVTGDDGQRQSVIETRRGRGFRFVAAVHQKMGTTSDPAYVGREEILRRIGDGFSADQALYEVLGLDTQALDEAVQKSILEEFPSLGS